MGSKHKTEERIFKQVYDTDLFFNYEHKDKPDFWINTSLEYKFGVEITELFENESSARLEKIDTYTEELLDSKKFRHKTDKKEIILDSIKILDKKGNHILETEAIVREIPCLNTYIDHLINCVSKKSRKSLEYNSNLNYNNLIINDHINSLSLIDKNKLSEYLFTDKFKQCLLNCSFEEVFLITEIKNEKNYFPLKRILYLYHIYFFQNIINRLHKSGENLSEEYYYSFLKEFLEYNGFLNLKLKNKKDKFELIYGMTGYHLFNNSVQLTLYEGINIDKFHENHIQKKYITKKVEKIIKEEKSKFSFSCGLGEKIEQK